jgi:hypothetical protein
MTTILSDQPTKSFSFTYTWGNKPANMQEAEISVWQFPDGEYTVDAEYLDDDASTWMQRRSTVELEEIIIANDFTFADIEDAIERRLSSLAENAYEDMIHNHYSR